MYTERHQRSLREDLITCRSQLLDVAAVTLQAAKPFEGSPCWRHMVYGVARRAGFVQHGLQRLFDALPPESQTSLPSSAVRDATLLLHALLMHVSGIWDNWAWAYLLRHECAPRHARDVGIFKEKVVGQLPPCLREFLKSERVQSWRRLHAIGSRDSLAHRIPPYIPPSVHDPETGNALRRRISDLEAQGRTGEVLDFAVQAVREGSPCFLFLAYAGDEEQNPMYLHPQVLSDAMLVAEFGRLFLKHWGEAPSA